MQSSVPLSSPSTGSLAPRPGWAGWTRAAAVVALCTILSELLSSRVDLADIIMVYLAGVVYIAMRQAMAVSVAAVAASIILFDLIFVPPRWGLNPINKAHFITFAVMLAVGLLISRLADQARTQRLLADRRAGRAQALAGLSAGLAAAPSREAIAECLAGTVRATFGVAGELVLADGVSQAGWLALPVQGSGGLLGTLAVQLSGRQPTAGELELLGAFAHQAAIALERCAYQEKTAAVQLQAEAERLRNTLLSGISHDFRTPLTTIVGAATSLLQQGDRLDELRRTQLIESVRDEAERLHSVLTDLLELTRLEEGAVQLSPEWCPADDLIAEALAVLGPRLATHRVSTAVAADAIVWCDPRLLEQALVNLVDNALRYTPAGTHIQIGVVARPGEWELVVADDGPGLPLGQEQEVFRKFHRGRTEPAGGGTGLGLAICAAVARLHQGRIEAANAGGARLTLTLPQPGRHPPDLKDD